VKQFFSAVASWFGHSYPGRLIAEFGRTQAGNYASGLAFNAFISMFPLILGLLAVLGLVTQSRHEHDVVLAAIVSFFPQDAATPIKAAFDGLSKYSGLFGGVGIAGLLWSGSSLFTSMEFSLGMVIGSRQRSFFRQRGMALVMTIFFAIALVVTIGVNSLVALPGLGWLFEPVVGLVVWYVFMLTVYRLVPNHTYPIRQLWPGVLIAGTAMEALTLLWPIYTNFSHKFSTYGAALALFFLLASWLYFLAEFILLGGAANRMHNGEPEVRGLLGDRIKRRTPVAEGSRGGGDVSPKRV
jgi:membrane protein